MIEFKRELITPSLAKKYIESNINNRRLKISNIARYAKDMANGRWKSDTAEPIKISKSGIILDGQNRLHAIIKSNTPIFFHVATNVEDDVFDVLDTGASRSAGDVFRIKGIKQENTIPSIIAMYNLLLDGTRVVVQKDKKATNAELLSQYLQDESFWQNVARQSHNWYLSFAKILQPSYIGGFYSYFLKLNESLAYQFMSQLTTGIGIENECISLLRQKLMQDKMSPRKMQPRLKMALIIKTWNFFVKGQNIKQLKFDTINEQFPTALSR